MEDDKEFMREYLLWVEGLLTAMDSSVKSDNPTNVWRYGGYYQFARKYNQIINAISLKIQLPPILDVFNIENIPGPMSTIAAQQKDLFDSVYANTAVLKGVLESRIGVVEDKTLALRDFFHARLRSAVFSVPDKERVIQDAVEQLLIGRNMQKGEDYDRETGRVKLSAKEYIPDFILLKLSLAIEVKLVSTKSRMKNVVDEINADIAAYSKKYRNLLFIVYDLGHIRDEVEFRKDLETSDNVSILVIKH